MEDHGSESNQEGDSPPLADSESLHRLIAQHTLALRAYARVILPSVDAIDDVMQEASVVIWRRRDQLRDEEGFLPWSKVIVRNISFQHRRRLVRDRHIFDDELVERLLTESDDEEEEDAGPPRLYRALLRCLDQLPEDRRQLVLTPYQGQGSVKDLAESTGKSPNSISLVLRRIRARLMRCVEEQISVKKSS